RCFSPVGNPLSLTLLGRLQLNSDCLTALGVKRGSTCPLGQETVVALYDYTAHRSDELTIHRSDIIQVLYKDNDNWWFGSLANGQQGYFPANYVAGEKEYEDQRSGLVPDSAPLLPDGQTEAEEGSPTLHEKSAITNEEAERSQDPCVLEDGTFQTTHQLGDMTDFKLLVELLSMKTSDLQFQFSSQKMFSQQSLVWIIFSFYDSCLIFFLYNFCPTGQESP
uniref:Abelson helper integration site 1 n=1 Tax=Dromaius novaehollandiae TaxID=8790 RepID=A0A8C4P7M4_DRONO